jgi:hypothetical protein
LLLSQMISKINLRLRRGEPTEDDRDDEGLDVLGARLVGVSREIGNVQTQSGVISQDSIEVCKKTLVSGSRARWGCKASLTGEECPSEGRTAQFGASGDDLTVADGATSSAQSVAENSQENNWCDNTLEGEEVLNLGVRNAEEGELKQEVEDKSTHSCCGDALAFGNVIGDVGKAWPDGCEQDGHALTSSRGLDTTTSLGSASIQSLGGQTNPSQTMARTQRDRTTK